MGTRAVLLLDLRQDVRAHLKYYGLKHEGRNDIVAIKRIRTKLQISQLGKRESGQ